MGENAELYATPGNERNVVIDWLIKHKVRYDENMSTEELIEIYRRKEVERI